MQKKNYPYYDDVPLLNDFQDLIFGGAQRYGDKTAFRFRRDGKVVEKTYNDVQNDTLCLGTALIDSGLAEGEHIALVAENSYEWLNVYFAVMVTGRVLVPIDRELTPEGILYIINHSESKAAVFSQSVLEKLLRHYEDDFAALSAAMPAVRRVVIIEQEADGEQTASLNAMRDFGRRLLALGDTRCKNCKIDRDKVASIIYTSGTTGVSKGVMLSQKNITTDFVNALRTLHINESCLSILPYNHTYESSLGVLCYLCMGRTININENLRTVLPNMKFFKPTDIQFVPAFVESIYKKVWAQAEESGKAKTLETALKTSRRLRKTGVDMRRVLFHDILKSFGGKIQRFVCGGASVKPHVCEFFEDIGITILTGYGISECSPLVTVSRDYFHDPYSCGVPIADCEVKIDSPNDAGEGEILVKGPNVMLGYFKNPEATEAAFRDGWFLTGDIGKFDEEGRLYITGRKKNIIVLKNGKNIYPEELESYFAQSELIAEILVYASADENNQDAAITAEIFPNQEKAKELGSDEIEKAIHAEVEAHNARLPVYKQIKRVTFRDTEFEKTTTRKIKRFVAQKKA